MHPFRTHTCGELRREHSSGSVRLSGWIFRKRDHGSLLFIDLRDHYGLTQVVIQPDRDFFETCQKLRLESVITVTGKVEPRTEDTINPELPTGAIELLADSVVVESEADPLPIYLAGEEDGPEDLRLKYRFLDLRRERMHKNIMLRSKVISDIRRRMIEDHGFSEFQTPILTSSSPEGARDYLVPSRVHPGKFYALPQSPQQFKQLLMLAGFDRYFQVASCFRDEDARADRSPGEHHQLDIEMSFVTPEDIFAVVESVLYGVFTKFSTWKVDATPFKRIPYAEAMVKYGSDKPDLRIPIEIVDISELFRTSKFNAFRSIVEKGGVIRAIPVTAIADKPRSFFDKLVEYAQSIGSKGLAYLVFEAGAVKGPLAKFLSPDDLTALSKMCGTKDGDVVFFVGEMAKEANRIAGDLRLKLGRDLDRVEKDCYRFCWIVDFPMYEFDDENKAVIFSHNPFSMPQGGLKALQEMDPLKIYAYQYDVVCNGYELGSGAIRNHQPEIMYKAFEIAGYSRESVDKDFGALIKAFRLGAPPHGGIAPGIDRIIMMLTHEENIREVIAFPMNQRAQDLMMNAPNDVSIRQLRELHIRVELPKHHEHKDQPVQDQLPKT
ncbi:MAG: aspartate--tRNA ligase [Lentisphaerae bacterium RIFOXYA12_FULL_48_11]|nr:MAG: aspartate--tRNA ligase [Lentisphaerae bacterium RIFOXYA12_FULL_48_11]